MTIIDKIEQEQLKSDTTDFSVGDTVKVNTRVVEGGKERIQLFQGIVIGKRGGNGLNSSFTVRKISYGTGVERVFCIHSPRIESVDLVKRGKVRRAKLNYLRDRVGKKATTVKSAE
ncbi:50S ribosomal protein L19 [Akkermansiaceae bacterium]|nr:50S ribosomal protein L19 [Akkermansiaceae bacterium]MDB4287298.1 50S ribosomal protein L19 [bacterium]MDA8875822.1 50S ribosomal protein L19 [Akkermansiaceae bacterium]MDA8967371.1 50S ribosomal protein L19 [Akkermansiaceae bacterium]MDB0056516.1 50S ribosomal protein L19 [Akkermansiaceae bacterium]